MPKISGREILSDTTEKSQARLLLIASVAIVSKVYHLPVSDMKMLGMEFPAAIFDVSVILLLAWQAYSYLVKWSGDLIAFRLWYSESSIWSNFGTNMKLDKTFISGGVECLKKFHELNLANLTDAELTSIPDDKKRLYDDFRNNVELYSVRLDHAGKKFKTVSAFGHFYVWIQGFLVPVASTIAAAYLVLKYGTFSLPSQL